MQQIRFSGYSAQRYAGSQLVNTDPQPPASSVGVYVGPRTFVEMVIFSVTVSLVTQLIMRKLFK